MGGRVRPVRPRDRPASTSRSTPQAVTGLASEAAWKRVLAVTGRPVAGSDRPYPAAQTTSPSWTSATASPGAVEAASARCAAPSTARSRPVRTGSRPHRRVTDLPALAIGVG